MRERGEHYDTAIIGGGPAAMGLFLAADRIDGGRGFNSFLGNGIALIERGPHIGPGSLGEYRIPANTSGSELFLGLGHGYSGRLHGVRWDDLGQYRFRGEAIVKEILAS
jgi:hypothetical protein